MLKRLLHIEAWIIILGLVAVFTNASAQVRSGAAFLKMLPGARLQSMAGAHTAVIDDPHAIFANPGAAGFLREWQWAASYTKWIADIYNASFIYGGAVPMPWSRQSRFAIGLLYQGVPEFNNSATTLPPASASDFVASLSVGQPLISDRIAVGANLKYFKSTLAQFSAQSFIYDIGLTTRTRTFNFGKSRGAFSVGAALNQNGSDLTFSRIGTPLPQTMRGGMAFYLGTHKGLNMLLSADYVSVKDEKGYMAVGAELMINRLLAVNAGYDFGSDLFKKASFGVSIRLDHVGLSLGDALPGRHNAFRLDFATMDEADFFSRTYRGTASHFATRPESFVFTAPAQADSVFTDVVLRWNDARDADIFDEVTFHVLLDHDSAKIADIVSAYEDDPGLFRSLLHSELAFNGQTTRTFIPTEGLNGGDYYWAVAAIDKDEQVRFARGESAIAHFSIPMTDIEIKEINFEHSPYITTDDYHGVIDIALQNNGERAVRNVKLVLKDEIEELDFALTALASASNDIELPSLQNNVVELTVPSLAPGELHHVQAEWRSTLLGKHRITVTADPEGTLSDTQRANNELQRIFHTIPKGVFTARDSVSVLQTSTTLIDMPLITEITFDPNSSMVKKEYAQDGALESILSVYAERLKENPDRHIQLQGYVDPNSDDNRVIGLADARSEAVKNALLQLGVDASQIQIKPGQILPFKTMRSDEQDSKWILEERRYVRISAAADSPLLLRPMRHQEVKIEQGNVLFISDIASATPLLRGSLCFESDSVKDQHELSFAENAARVPDVSWRPGASDPTPWFNKVTSYHLSVTDSLGRQFRTEKGQLTMTRDDRTKRQILSVPLQFGKTDPMAEFYWQEIFDYAKQVLADTSMRLRFEGHACAIGSVEVNERLSKERASRFDAEFKNYLASLQNDPSASIASRIEGAIGHGESKPLILALSSGDVLLGDNNTAMGRKMNRRIELVFHKNGVAH
ncbi:PorV/PorQ family protein [candidate division KSB1 bacterium]|nr:PorV/PorQ family protein [candidate division KSB1 bacterium]RQW01431.1 MAG: PorV/PorQ family protein [candidate division KSB1 bacterium]